jgi:hypothetical protein
MRPVRIFVAALALCAAGAGCRAADITAPQAPPAARHDEEGGGAMGSDGITSGMTGATLGDSTAVTPPGGDRGGFIGSGG